MTPQDTPQIRVPASLLPGDGRFGCGPSKVRPEAVAALAEVSRSWLGTSHRQPPVKRVVGRIREGLRTLFSLPSGWEIVLGNGGSTTFWDVATFGLIEQASQHLVFGEFSSKFAAAAEATPHLGEPSIISSPPGTHPWPKGEPDVDAYCLTHNETSTGVSMPLERPTDAPGLVVVDATSAAGALRWDPAEVDVYYFAPQKVFAADGGLWVALLSPAAVERVATVKASRRWMPASLDLSIALDNARLDQTYNTPALATLFLLDQQLQWILAHGGLTWANARCRQSSSILYEWAEASVYATPFVAEPAMRSSVVGTIDLAGVDADTVSAVLRANGIVDTDSYRKLGRNQLRIGMFPAVEPDDVAQLTRAVDFVVDTLTGA